MPLGITVGVTGFTGGVTGLTGGVTGLTGGGTITVLFWHIWVTGSNVSQDTHNLVSTLKYLAVLGHPRQCVPLKNGAVRGQINE